MYYSLSLKTGNFMAIALFFIPPKIWILIEYTFQFSLPTRKSIFFWKVVQYNDYWNSYWYNQYLESHLQTMLLMMGKIIYKIFRKLSFQKQWMVTKHMVSQGKTETLFIPFSGYEILGKLFKILV